MGRPALLIALGSFAVIVLGAVLTWAIIAAGGPGPTPTSTAGGPQPVVTPAPTETPAATPSPTPTPTDEPEDAPPGPVTGLAVKLAPHAVTLSWEAPDDPDVVRYLIVQKPGTQPPADAGDGDIVGDVPATELRFTDRSSNLKPGLEVGYAVFARDAAHATSPAAGIAVTLPAALTVTPVDVAGQLTQQEVDALLTDSGSLAFTAFSEKGPWKAVVKPGSGVVGAVTVVLTEPKGSAPGAVVWTYAVENAKLRDLAEGAKRDEEFVIELRDGTDKVKTTVTVTLLGINDAPTAAAIAPQSAIAGEPFAFPVPPGAFADVDSTDTLTLSVGALPGWLSFTGAAFTGTPSDGDIGQVAVTVVATDPHGATASADLVIDVGEPLPKPNDPPEPVADAVLFDLAVDPLSTTAQLLANDTDPDDGPNPLAAMPAAAVWMVDGEVAGMYTIDAAGLLTVTSGVAADGPLQRLAPGERVTATIPYAVTDGTDQATSRAEITVIGAEPTKGVYPVTKVMVPEPLLFGYGEGRGLGRSGRSVFITSSGIG